jgi:hypothetical protein
VAQARVCKTLDAGSIPAAASTAGAHARRALSVVGTIERGAVATKAHELAELCAVTATAPTK